MYPRSFDYTAPETLDAALEAAARPGARLLAGGASLVPMLKLRLVAPELLVDLRRVPGLDEITTDGATVRIGAMATHAAVAAAAPVREGAAALAAAAALVGDVAVRYQGTVCGALAHADSVADEPGPALALAARLVVRSAAGERTIPAEEFFVDAFTTSAEPGDVVTAVEVPVARPGQGSAYHKIGRRGPGADYPVAGAAAWVEMGDAGVTGARVALTGASTKATLLGAVAEALVGTDGSDAAIESAVAGAADGVPILGDVHGSEDYKRYLVPIVAARALRMARDAARA